MKNNNFPIVFHGFSYGFPEGIFLIGIPQWYFGYVGYIGYSLSHLKTYCDRSTIYPCCIPSSILRMSVYHLYHNHIYLSIFFSSPSIDLLPHRRLALAAAAALAALAAVAGPAAPAQHAQPAAALGFPGRAVHWLVLLRRHPENRWASPWITGVYQQNDRCF